MKNGEIIRRVLSISLVFSLPVFYVQGQTTPNPGALTSVAFDTSGFPQWVKDLRRFEIVAFGSFPFAMFAATFATDTKRWADNGMDWSEEGRRYAPWPLKSAGAENMTNREQEMTMAIAAGISGAVALADFVIVQIKRYSDRKRAESLPAGTPIIIKKPWPPVSEKDNAGNDAVSPEGADAGAPLQAE
ncbi:MAG: hypothetical protein LBS57_02120 [Treponema sp.]|jgi:hypothetical protein|nr:hypothetical protein [Treponema sp.]